ncbi:MAG: Tryptophan synthase, beta subunit [Leptospirillum sp. Group II 'C75']|jgi:tryptophan synthase beta chain|uniref:Tryptophan synthase beta chain n=1 Tax=Leptospirillum ferriphilum TaxID=178606 RepID=A0A1V3SWU1_9BACT|nr:MULTISPECIES: tryptophan synthase subunit beta [Leptospirillum]AKS24035.1 tryptophan synthase subunit beta [Leptospirillum sp. Group II 'CF-1']EAY56749.1 MAG: Tryptophan synthase, beta subunit [Leptospirillum rubarum]EIJ76673.1 MAG: Tryptophan synthase, beta subunit [Leptospirillum sp. Group II 'C75']OOH73660.1 tryptophan synthase subunit beta [Leptospirillum ferriphilum]
METRSKVTAPSFRRPSSLPDKNGYFGEFGGRFVSESLMEALYELEDAFRTAWKDNAFHREMEAVYKDFIGRPSPLYFAEALTEKTGGARLYLKREDLNHTGAHKINNTVGQALLARRMGKKRLIAETGAGQHGVATATVAARYNFECEIYMGSEDVRRQALNVFRMNLLGATVRPVDQGTKTLKDAISEALRDWSQSVLTTHYVLGTAFGPHPFPLMVRSFQSVIGREARKQILRKEGRLPDALVACVGGGSNAMGLFYPFLSDQQCALWGMEAGGRSMSAGEHAARFQTGRVGVLQGSKTYVLQDNDGQIEKTHSVSAGLDYSAVGPELAYYRDSGRIVFSSVSDEEAMEGFEMLSRTEGILPALESAHAIAGAIRLARQMDRSRIILVNLSGRGDKDVMEVARIKGVSLT